MIDIRTLLQAARLGVTFFTKHILNTYSQLINAKSASVGGPSRFFLLFFIINTCDIQYKGKKED